LLSAVLLVLPQVVAALPWLYSLDPKTFRKQFTTSTGLGSFTLVVLGLVFGLTIALNYRGASESLQLYGRIYGAFLHLQILLDLFLFAPQLLILLWPKGGAVTLSAFRESWRQPMFWMILFFGILATWIAVVLPYFTFGDDFKMMKQIGFDIIMLCTLLFGAIAASISISEEIEGRTAITVMSKPITRRQFFIGKYLGVLFACGLMSGVLLINLNFALLANPELDQINKDRAYDPMPEQAKAGLVPVIEKNLQAGPPRIFGRGLGLWFGEVFAHTFGVALGFGQVMVLVAIATALATRLQFAVNLVIVVFVYLAGHLAPVISRATEGLQGSQSTSEELINFLAKLFGAILPSLEFFNMGPAIIRETPLDLWSFIGYTITVLGYSLIYTGICLIIGLLMFEDRDLS
jgi:ABC-type transport system involved in multi-copper enzyme maturation permease subunit